MDKNLRTPENIDKLIERQAGTPSYVDGLYPPVSNNGGVTKSASKGKVYVKKYNKSKRGK